jgi:hypothetical protein
MSETPTTRPEIAESGADNTERESFDPVADDDIPESAGAKKVDAAERFDKVKKSDYEIMLELLGNLVDGSGKPLPDLESVIRAATDHLKEIYGETAISMEKVRGLYEILNAIPDMLNEGSATALDKHPNARKEITYALCEPLLRGHLESHEILFLVQRIEVKPKAEITASPKGISGYDSVFHYDDGIVTISQESLDGSLGVAPDFRHLFNHEVAHGVSDATFFKGVSSEQFNHEINATEVPAFSSKMTAEVRRILDSAESLAGSLPQHTSTVLKSLRPENIKKDYESLSEDSKKRLGLDSEAKYLVYRRYMAAKEIITDFFAVYQQSDGTLDDFIRVAVGKCYQSEFSRFASKAFGISAPDSKTARSETLKKIAEINSQIESGELSREDAALRYPKYAEFAGSLSVFFASIKASFENREDITLESDEDDWLYDSFGYYDGAGGFQPQAQSTAAQGEKSDSGIVQESKALLQEFAKIGEITQPITG